MAKKSAKRNLIASVLAMSISASMLVGSTFAWFTDTATSSNNVIQTGTLDVGMYWTETFGGEWNDVAAKDATPIYNNTNWEPQYTDVKYVKIANEGSLALKYVLNVIPTGTVGELAKVIDVYLIKDVKAAVTKADVANATPDGTFQDLIDGTISISGSLLSGEESQVAIVLQMQNVGNEYQNQSIGDSFELQLLATQYTYEEDSFDKEYDADAFLGTYIEINEGDDLLTELKTAAADQPVYVSLNTDVEWETEGHHGENDITPASEIIIKGNGHTLTATGAGVTPLGDKEAPMTLKDIKIVDKSVSYTESSWEFTYLELGGTELICENVTFADEIQTGAKATFTNCTFESNEESVYAAWIAGGTATFTGCTFTGYRGLKTHEAYGSEVTSLIVDNCTFKNLVKKPGLAIGDLNADTVVSITNSKFIHCQKGDQGLYIYESDTDVTTFDFTAKDNTITFDEETTKVEADITAPYGNKYAVALNGGVLDGNGNELSIDFNLDDGSADDYGIMTQGGTVKNLTIKEGCRAIMLMYAKEDVILDNVNIGGDGVLYAINTGESADDGSTKNVNLIVTNSTLAGWTSFADIKSASFTNVKFEQGTYYGPDSIYGRVFKPYVNTTLTDCSFVAHMNLDLSKLTQGHKITIKNCTVDGQAVTADVFTVPANDADYDTQLFTVDLPSWASSINDCIVFA